MTPSCVASAIWLPGRPLCGCRGPYVVVDGAGLVRACDVFDVGVPLRDAGTALPSCAHPRRPARGGCRPWPRACSTSHAWAGPRLLVRRPLCIAGGITPV